MSLQFEKRGFDLQLCGNYGEVQLPTQSFQYFPVNGPACGLVMVTGLHGCYLSLGVGVLTNIIH